jgi:hypothetical protein
VRIENLEVSKEISETGIGCFVLERKEIENYVLVPKPLIRTMRNRASAKGGVLSKRKAKDILLLLSEDQKHEVQSQLIAKAREFKKKKNPHLDDSTITAPILKEFDEKWSDLESRLKILGGKDFVSQLSAYMGNEFGTSITVSQIIDNMRLDEIPNSLQDTLLRLDKFMKS